MSIKALQDYTFTAKYARWLPEKNRRETWQESVERVKNMMLLKYKDFNIEEDINWAYDLMLKKRVLGSQRALQFGGEPALNKNCRIYNCLDKSTKFITSEGVKDFIDFKDGDSVCVLTHAGKWETAIVREYEEQNIFQIKFKKANAEYIVSATKDHRWMLNDGSITTSLKCGDKIYRPENIFGEFNYDTATIEEKLYWCYGFVYGDGTVNNNHSMVRLCGDDTKYESRFTDLGFKSSSSLSLFGDVIVYTGKYMKTTPDPKNDSPELIRAFVAGYLSADGTTNSNIKNSDTSQYTNIQSSDIDHIEFIKKCFPIAGVWIVSEKELTGQKTNYGIRPYTILFRICDNSNSKFSQIWTVNSIDFIKKDKCWCLEVKNDKTFTLPSGIITGNCTGTYIDRPRVFQEYMYMLLCGCGVGFSVQKHHIAKLPNLIKQKRYNKVFLIPDTIEGWSDAIGVLVCSYFDSDHEWNEYIGRNIEFDFSKIRAAGSSLSSVGKAPGPKPLKKCLKQIQTILDTAISNSQEKLSSLQIYDILMYSADAVISGGVRRSATICLFSPDDQEMITSKSGNWFKDNPQRGRSNNSALILRDKTTKEEFQKIVNYSREFGEPGYYWATSTEEQPNPCVEIGFYCYDSNGNSGIQMCNLSTINSSKCKTKELFYEACKAASIIGTLQAGFTDFPYLGSITEEIVRRESLIGVSMTGIMENVEICLDPDIQKRGAEVVKNTNKELAKKININQAARTTCCKPEGTSSCLLGTTSGIHPHHAKRYIRRVQANKLEEIYKYFQNINPIACEESVWSNNESDDVISFCVEIPDGSKTKNQVNAISLLEYVKSTQINWVMGGKNKELCTKPFLEHNVSNTIHVKNDEWDSVIDFIFDNRQYFTGVSLLAMSGDKDYPQAPFTTIYLPSEITREYGNGSLFVSGLIQKALELYDDNLWKACEVLLSGKTKGDSKKEWKQRCEKFSDRYLDGSLKKLVYCMKDVYNYKLWIDLNREYKDVDYTKMYEDKDNTNFEGEASCVGGKCEL